MHPHQEEKRQRDAQVQQGKRPLVDTPDPARHGGRATRLSELKRGIPLASPSSLSTRPRELEAEGLIERRRSAGGSSWTYHLGERGVYPVVLALGACWTRRELEEHEIDLDLLLWAMEKAVHPDAFGDGRTVVEVDVTDQPATSGGGGSLTRTGVASSAWRLRASTLPTFGEVTFRCAKRAPKDSSPPTEAARRSTRLRTGSGSACLPMSVRNARQRRHDPAIKPEFSKV